MTARKPVYLAADNTPFPTAAEADRHDAKAAMAKLFEDWLADSGEHNWEPDSVHDAAVYIADEVANDPAPLLAAMRKAGCRVVTRKPKVEPRKRGGPKLPAAAE